MPLAVIHARAAERTTVGAIRWDAWFADTVNPYETNLADKQWHGRLPFFARIISGTNVQVRGDTQAAVDQEIEGKTMLFYAWNEVDEGGWLVPDKGRGTGKLDEIRKVADERRKVKSTTGTP